MLEGAEAAASLTYSEQPASGIHAWTAMDAELESHWLAMTGSYRQLLNWDDTITLTALTVPLTAWNEDRH